MPQNDSTAYIDNMREWLSKQPTGVGVRPWAISMRKSGRMVPLDRWWGRFLARQSWF